MSLHFLLSAGRGPKECSWALVQLLGRLEADASRHRLTTHRVETTPGERPATFRSVLLCISGAGAEAFAASWSGTLCWQAPSPYRSKAGRKNWYVTARTCEFGTRPMPFQEADVDVVGCRTGGPGGQHRDKASTAAHATHRPSGLVVVVGTERQFGLNRRIAIELLRKRLESREQAARHSAITNRWRIHDEVVRGNPTRTERPD